MMMNFTPYKEEYERLKRIAWRGEHNARTNPIGCLPNNDLENLWTDYNILIDKLSQYDEFSIFIPITDQNEVRKFSGDGKFTQQSFRSINDAFSKMDIIIQNNTI